jgi:glycine dehydrogenase
MFESFSQRHNGQKADLSEMLKTVGVSSVAELVDNVIPQNIRLKNSLNLPDAKSEVELIKALKEIAGQNQLWRSYIGTGYHGTVTPPVILRNILENPGWYTQYTPYQAEIAQGRLEALLNFQTIISDLSGLPVANASLLDEATACAEAMTLLYGNGKRNVFLVSDKLHPQNIALLESRAKPLGIELIIGDWKGFTFDETVFGAILQYPDTTGKVEDYSDLTEAAHQNGAFVAVAADILSLCVLEAPGNWGADVVVGSAQRFGVPMGYGGPHAAFMACKDEFKRKMPGRIIGISKDSNGNSALRMALQTREQHIRRDKATSNICTAQVLLAIMASMYAVWHGKEGLQRIANRVHKLTKTLSNGLQENGVLVAESAFFDTLLLKNVNTEALQKAAAKQEINFRYFENGDVGISLDETTTPQDVADILSVFGISANVEHLLEKVADVYEGVCARTSDFLTHPTFSNYQTEHELLRYIHRLQSRDLSLTTSMIPLGSCTMKLNATTEMIPVTWAEFGNLHPFAPQSQTKGYQQIFTELEAWLNEITGFAGTSLQPNSGAQGEYAGLMVIRQYHESRGDFHRNICLIPSSAHGTNPASAVMQGMKVVVVKCDDNGNIDVADLQEKAEANRENLAALMVTYPSTHGVFEAAITQICQIIHDCGGQVYMDGANMNAQVGLTSPAAIGADVCHLNLHKTFCIPHGGGGPGMGPICVAAHLVPFLPNHPVIDLGKTGDTISAAPYGSASILLISYAYIAMMGAQGLKEATEWAILNANYMAKRLENHYPVLYKGESGFNAHEFMLDIRPIKKDSGISEEDVAKRLMDYGFHAPTMSFPVAGTIMLEPTESETKAELDRYCDALIAIRQEIREVEEGIYPAEDNVLKNAPHTAQVLISETWQRSYSREKAAYPTEQTRLHKFFPYVGRIDNAFGDRNLICTCAPIEAYAE